MLNLQERKELKFKNFVNYFEKNIDKKIVEISENYDVSIGNLNDNSIYVDYERKILIYKLQNVRPLGESEDISAIWGIIFHKDKVINIYCYDYQKNFENEKKDFLNTIMSYK